MKNQATSSEERVARQPRKRRLLREPQFLTWTVQFSVDKSWVADGFDLDNDRAHDMIASDLSYAYGHELKAKVIRHPKKALVLQLQGYQPNGRPRPADSEELPPLPRKKKGRSA